MLLSLGRVAVLGVSGYFSSLVRTVPFEHVVLRCVAFGLLSVFSPFRILFWSLLHFVCPCCVFLRVADRFRTLDLVPPSAGEDFVAGSLSSWLRVGRIAPWMPTGFNSALGFRLGFLV